MRKFYCFLSVLATVLMSCSDDKTPEVGPLPPPIDKVAPELTIEVLVLDRTEVSFKLVTDKAEDYVYAVLPADAAAPESAEALFKEGTVGMFTTKEAVAIDRTLCANNKYVLYAAARTINPYVYSNVVSEELDTHMDYTQSITLDAVTRNSFTYHIKPAGKGEYRHICLRKSDYDWFVSFMGINHDMYVGSYGLRSEGEQSFSFTDAYLNEGGYPIYIYSDTEYIIIYGMADPSSRFKVLSSEHIAFRTAEAGEAPYGIEIVPEDIQSMSARITITPDEGIVRYRTAVAPTVEFDAAWIEGESVVRGMIIGDPTDQTRNMTGTIRLDPSGLDPQTEYTVGVVGFDANEREKVVFKTFTTADPSGPKAEFTITPQTTETPWQSVAVHLKAKNAVDIRVCLETKALFDAVMAQPGYSGSIDDIIRDEGIPLTPEQLEKALGEGVLCSSDDLQPYTEYVYGFYGVNEEKVSSVATYEFRTEAAPVTDLRLQMVGDFDATITDMDGRQHSFRVAVSDGLTETLREEYALKNWLAICGFEPCGVAYCSPQDLLDKGWAATAAEADLNYGPKIILEVKQDDTVTTGSVNPNTSQLDFNMGIFNGKYLWFKGYAKAQNGNIMSGAQCFPVEVSEDRNTITIKGVEGTVFGSEQVMYYPGVYDGENQWFGGHDIFRGGSDMVLTRVKAEPASAEVVRSRAAGTLKVPDYVRLDLSKRSSEADLRMQMSRSFSDNR